MKIFLFFNKFASFKNEDVILFIQEILQENQFSLFVSKSNAWKINIKTV